MRRYNDDDSFLYSTDEVPFDEIPPEPGRCVSRGRDSTKLTIKVDRTIVRDVEDSEEDEVDHRALKRTINVSKDDHERRKEDILIHNQKKERNDQERRKDDQERRKDDHEKRKEDILIHNHYRKKERKDQERRKEDHDKRKEDILIHNRNQKESETIQRVGKRPRCEINSKDKSVEACKRVQLQIIQESYYDDAEESIIEQGSKFVSRAEFHSESDLRLEINSIKHEKEKMRNEIFDALKMDKPSKDILQQYSKPKRGGEIIEQPNYQDSIKAELLNKKISSILSKDAIQAKVQDILQDLTNTQHEENFSRTFDEVPVQGYVDPQSHQFPQSFNHYQKTKQLAEEQQMPSDQAYYRQDLPQPNYHPPVAQPYYEQYPPSIPLQTVPPCQPHPHPGPVEQPYYEQYQSVPHAQPVPSTQPYYNEAPHSSISTQIYPNFGPYDANKPPAYKQTEPPPSQPPPHQQNQLQQMAEPTYESYYPPSNPNAAPNPQQQPGYKSYYPQQSQHDRGPAPYPPNVQHPDPYHPGYPPQRPPVAVTPPQASASNEPFNSYKGIPFNRIQDNVEGKPLAYNQPVAQTKPLSAEESKYGFFCHKCRLGYNSAEAWRTHICCDLHKILTGVWFIYKPFSLELKHGVKIYCICCQKKMEFTTNQSYKQHMSGKIHKKGEMMWLAMGRPLPKHPYVRVSDLNKNSDFALG